MSFMQGSEGGVDEMMESSIWLGVIVSAGDLPGEWWIRVGGATQIVAELTVPADLSLDLGSRVWVERLPNGHHRFLQPWR